MAQHLWWDQGLDPWDCEWLRNGSDQGFDPLGLFYLRLRMAQHLRRHLDREPLFVRAFLRAQVPHKAQGLIP